MKFKMPVNIVFYVNIRIFITDFSETESNSIVASTKAAAAANSDSDGTVYFPVNNEKVFGLDITEIVGAYGYTNNATRQKIGTTNRWWTRSVYDDNGNLPIDQYVVDVTASGSDDAFDISFYADSQYYVGASPAMNIDKSKILFTSAADFAKGDFAENAAYTGHEWKLTLKDSNDFSTDASLSKTTVAPGNSVTVNHKSLQSFTDAGYTNVTAALTDASGNIVCYGSVDSSSTSTSSTVTIPQNVAKGEYTLSVYAEKWNGAKKTDIATGTGYTAPITVGDEPESPAAPFVPVVHPVDVHENISGGNLEYTKAPELYTEFIASVKVPAGEKLPESVTVTVGGKELLPSEYKYDPSTGVIVIPAYKVTGDITITAAGIKTSAVRPLMLLKGISSGHSIIHTWTKVKGADGYMIYGSQCGYTNKCEYIRSFSNTTFKYVTRNHKKNTSYKYYAKAYKIVNGKKVTLAISETTHTKVLPTVKSNATKVTGVAKTISLKTGKSYQLKPVVKHLKGICGSAKWC